MSTPSSELKTRRGRKAAVSQELLLAFTGLHEIISGKTEFYSITDERASNSGRQDV
jgi:hypothetical protein